MRQQKGVMRYFIAKPNMRQQKGVMCQYTAKANMRQQRVLCASTQLKLT